MLQERFNGDVLRSRKRLPASALKRLTCSVTQENQDALNVEARRLGMSVSEYLIRCHRIATLLSEFQKAHPGGSLYLETRDGRRQALLIV